MAKIAILQFANTSIDNRLLECLHHAGLEWMIWKDTQDISELSFCSAYILPPGDISEGLHPELFAAQDEIISFFASSRAAIQTYFRNGLGGAFFNCIRISSRH